MERIILIVSPEDYEVAEEKFYELELWDFFDLVVDHSPRLPEAA